MDVLVTDWDDLWRLPRVLDEAAAQAAEVTAHAVRWVARRDGFEPSPVCLLRPLAEAMDAVRWAFEEAGRAAVTDLAGLREGVEVAARALEDADADVPVILPDLPREAA